ncbi:MAG TPA: dCTP deaminase [bacterium]
MILSDATLRDMMARKELVVEPIEDHQIQPASIDLRLGRHFLKVNEDDFDIIRMDQPINYMEVERDEIIIPPHTFMLATTMEYVKLPNDLTAFVEGRSSVGRVGLFVQNAGWVDPGFEGELTLELFNANRQPIRLQAGRRVCQLVFARMDRPAQTPYKGKYMGQRKPVGSRLHQDADRG